MKLLNACVVATVVVLMGDALAMKPGPFEPIDFRDRVSKVRVVSKPGDKELTQIFDKSGKKLWEMSEFVGRHILTVSADGAFLMLTGNYHFGNKLRLSPDETVAVIYERGKLMKRYTLADVLSGDPEALAVERKLDVIGGGWVNLDQLVTSVTADWGARQVTIRLWDGSAQQKPF